MAKKPNTVNTLVTKQFYYPALDGLRFFAFFIVFLHHTLAGVNSELPVLNFLLVIIHKNGWVGVDLFFVLSGFLITTLLLKERERFGKFSLKDFWIRRSLRIWPLYYLALIMGFFITPSISTTFFGSDYSNPKFGNQIEQQLGLYLAFLGNWAVSFNGYGYFTTISHLWTISIEEQFYFLWPILLLFIRGKWSTLIAGFLIISTALLVRLYLAISGIEHPGIYTNTFARIDTLTIGAIIALLAFYAPNLLTLIKKLCTTSVLLVVLGLFTLILYRIYLFDPSQILVLVFGYLIIALFMAYFVIYALQIETGLAKFLSLRWLVFLGKISYGLYIWHVLAIQIVNQTINIGFLEHIFDFVLTVIMAYLSYKLYESKFLQLKTKFTKIISRPI